MSLWTCPAHGLTGPMACCPSASRAHVRCEHGDTLGWCEECQPSPRVFFAPECSRAACPTPDSCDEYGCRHPKNGPQLVQDEMSTGVLDFDPTERAARARIAKLLGRDPGGYAAFMIDDKPVTAIQFLAHLTATAPVDAERDPQPVRLSGPVH